VTIINAAPAGSGAIITAASATLGGVDRALPSGSNRFMIPPDGPPRGIPAPRDERVTLLFTLSDTKDVTDVEASATYKVYGSTRTEHSSVHTTEDQPFTLMDFPFLLPDAKSSEHPVASLIADNRAVPPPSASLLAPLSEEHQPDKDTKRKRKTPRRRKTNE
jgi:hypothetical protein